MFDEDLTRVFRKNLDEIRSVRNDPIVLQYLLVIDRALQPLKMAEVQEASISLEAHVWECLHLTTWKDVDPQYRKVYGLITWTLAVCYAASTNVPVANIHQLIDKGILLGSPETIDMLLSCHSQIQIQEAASSLPAPGDSPAPSFLAPRIASCAQSIFSHKFRETIPKPIDLLLKKPIPTIHEPDLMTFYTQYFLADQPVVLRGCLENWKALRRWSDLEYIDRVGGHRLVPVEVGRDYLSSDSGQTLMTIREFICQYILDDSTYSDSAASVSAAPHKKRKISPSSQSRVGAADIDTADRSESNENTSIGYIAQHCLFDQIPDLRRDISVPDYCSFLQPGDEEEEEGASSKDVLINAWFGPVSP